MLRYLRMVAVVVIFSMVAFLGAFIKFGGAAASIALDSWASFFVAAFFGPLYGGVVAAIGHLLSAGTGGFPFTPPVHGLIALLQFAWAFAFGLIIMHFNNFAGLIVASVVVVLLNGVVAPLIIGGVFPELMAVMKTLIPVLALASLVNVSLAAAVLLVMKRARKPS